MIRLTNLGLRRFASIPPRRQNFFQLNPIFPDQGQKDFDIYNVDYNHILSGPLAIQDETRYQKIKEKLTKQVYLGPILQKTYDMSRGQYEIDQETGFPIGIHEDFDNFIEIFKREKKVGSNIIGQFQDLVMNLMKKFNAKSQLQLIKIFRLNLATSKKTSFKDKIRSLVINSAFLRFIKQRKSQGLSNQTLKLEEIEPYLKNNELPLKRQGQQISSKQIEQVVFRQSLKQIDDKIQKLQEQIQKKALANGTYVPTFHPKFGQSIKESNQFNANYDFNHPRGFLTQIVSTGQGASPSQLQDNFIQQRINKLFFMRALEQIQSKKELTADQLIDEHDLPLNIRSKDKLINSLLYKYKEYDLLVEPDLSDIYGEIDIALKKITVKVVPNFLQNEADNEKTYTSASSQVKERIISKDVLLWKQLDVQEIFDAERYQEQIVNKIKIDQNQLAQISPSPVLELSLNKMPFNLYRHADLDKFGVFNQYRKKIYKDYITDKVIDPEIEFKYFSLDQAQKKLQRVKKPEEIPDKFYGHATRKSSQAEVFVVKGTGKVIINNQPLADYCGDVYHRAEALKPLIFTQTAGQYDCEFTVVGGGVHSQSECMSMALTKALIMINPKYQKILSQFGLVGNDDRRNQAKKAGFYTARVRPPYVRR